MRALMLAAPPGEPEPLLNRGGTAEPVDGERGDRRDVFRDLRFERASPVEARHVDFEFAAVEPANQLHHLALGSADVEARQEKGNRVPSTSRHARQ